MDDYCYWLDETKIESTEVKEQVDKIKAAREKEAREQMDIIDKWLPLDIIKFIIAPFLLHTKISIFQIKYNRWASYAMESI